MSQIHGLCLIKNEADIIEASLTAALHWCDQIYVFDNGSTDGTWEHVQRLAKGHPEIIAYRHKDVPFSEGLRHDIFCRYRHQAQEGDWWCRLDADEFYVDDPRVFLLKVRQPYGVIWAASLTYYFTDEDATRYREDPARYADDVPVEEKCRYYFNHWSEVRFFRHSAALQWREDRGWPDNLLTRYGSYPVRILVKHYPYRSPQQIEKRLRTRLPAIRAGKFRHEAVLNWASMNDPKVIAIERRRWENPGYLDPQGELELTWESRVVSAANLQFDSHDRRFVLNEDLMPPIPNPTRRRRLRESRWINNRITRPILHTLRVAKHRLRGNK